MGYNETFRQKRRGFYLKNEQNLLLLFVKCDKEIRAYNNCLIFGQVVWHFTD